MMNLGFLTLGVLIVAAPAYAVVSPSPSAPAYTTLQWGPLSDDGNMSGTASTYAAGSTTYVANDPNLDGQGAVRGQDTLGINFGFTTKQVAFNYYAGANRPSEIIIAGGTYTVTTGAESTIDIYSATGFGGLYFRTVASGIDGVNVFDVGTMYFSNSNQPIFAQFGAGIPTTVPEPATISLFLLGVVAASVRKRKLLASALRSMFRGDTVVSNPIQASNFSL